MLAGLSVSSGSPGDSWDEVVHGAPLASTSTLLMFLPSSSLLPCSMATCPIISASWGIAGVLANITPSPIKTGSA